MSNYFTDEDKETRTLIEHCVKGMDAKTAKDYLINCLVPKFRSRMTVKQLFENEIKAGKDLKKMLDEKKEV
jgi:hypothetical protein